MKKNSEIRSMASQSLKGMWGRYILAIIATMVLQSFVSSLLLSVVNRSSQQSGESIIQYLLEYFVFFALTLSLSIMALYLIRQKGIQISDIFLVFDKRFYWAFFLLNLVSALANYLVSFIVFLPHLVIGGLNQYLDLILNFNSGITIDTDWFGSSISFIIGFLISVVLFLFVSQIVTGVFQIAIYLRYDHSELTTIQAIKGAWNLLRKHVGQYILLQLSLLGWMILGLLAFIIGMFWALAYTNTANAAFYQALVDEQEAQD
jgi:uncharacterized membrane protein